MAFASRENKIKFHHHPITKTVNFIMHEKSKVAFTEGLVEILGFEPEEYSDLK